MIQLLDATLREGEQTFGVRFTLEQKVELAKLLDEISVDYIEAGHPAISEYDLESVRAVANLGLNAEILGHARAKKEDIDAVAESGCRWVGIFCGINELSRKNKLNGREKKDVYSMVEEAIKYAEERGLKVRYTVEDSTRTTARDLIHVAQLAKNSGADRLCIADTVGCSIPLKMRSLVSKLKKILPIEVHCHNDYGLALANSLAAYESGAEVISTSVNGFGERAGITSLQELKVALGNLYSEEGYKKNFKALFELSKRVEEITGIKPDALRPIVGENAFTHTSKLHRKAVRLNSHTYEQLSPEEFGRQRKIALPNVIIPKKIPATELPFHKENAPGQRHVFVDRRFFQDTHFYVIGRRAEGVPEKQEEYVSPHAHNCESFFVFVGDGEDLEGICAIVDVGWEKKKVESPSAVFIPSYTKHSYMMSKGKGWFFNIVRSPDYERSLTEIEEHLDKEINLIEKAKKQCKPPRAGKRPISSDLELIRNPVRYIFDIKDSGLYLALHDINNDSPFTYTMVPHYHDTDEMYALFNRPGEQLTIDLESEGQVQRVSSPALIYHKKGIVHKYSYVSGCGKILIALEERRPGEGYHFKKMEP